MANLSPEQKNVLEIVNTNSKKGIATTAEMVQYVIHTGRSNAAKHLQNIANKGYIKAISGKQPAEYISTDPEYVSIDFLQKTPPPSENDNLGKTSVAKVRAKGKDYAVVNNKLQLRALGISAITEIEGLANLETLQELHLPDNNIEHIKGLGHLRNLTLLDLSNNKMERIEGLDFLSSLKDLFLSGNKIKRIEGLNDLTNLQFLFLDSNEIEKLEGLDALKNLDALNAEENKIQKLEGLGGLQNLRELYLDNNPITRIEGLDELKSLEKYSFDEKLIASWPRDKNGTRILTAKDLVAYCRQTTAEQICLERLKKLVRVSKSLKISQIAQILEMNEKELYPRIIDWADQFKFTLDEDLVRFEGGQTEEFIKKMEEDFAKWGKDAPKKN